MYQQKYNYEGASFYGFDKFLQRLWENSLKSNGISMDNYFETVKNRQKITEYINYLEDYVYGLIALDYVNEGNIKDVIKYIKELESFNILPKDKRGVYGVTIGNKIYMNPSIGASPYLSEQDRTRLYIGHELGHILHFMWEEDCQLYNKNIIKKPKLNKIYQQFLNDNKILINEGFTMLEEALVQNISEDVAYFFADKKRPREQTYRVPTIFRGLPYVSNFDFYKELQTPAIKFGRTIRGIGTSSNTSDREILKELCQASLQKDFIKNIISSYSEFPYLEQDLMVMLLCMGRIKDASYSRFGYRMVSDSLDLSFDYYTHFIKLCDKYEDYRPKIENLNKEKILNK